ncbi:MAG: EAL domain-containing protein [Desulfuromonadales bacterium]
MSNEQKEFFGKVLVVDDDFAVRILAHETLEQAGFEVTVVDNGLDAIALFDTFNPDIILLDVMMPGMDGFQTCQEIRSTPDGADVPILIMTGLDDLESITAAYRSGATDFVTKPIQWLVLPYRVQYLIRSGMAYIERKRAEERIKELAFFDQLTGLPNRILLLDRLTQAMTASSRNGSYGALLFIDLDNFKTINDTLGHDMGDLLLQQVAERLTTCVRAGDTTARLGGDEFVVMLANLSTDERAAASQTEIVGDKVIATLNQPYLLRGITHHNTPSIGITLFNGLQAEIEVLLRQADIAMYRSKEAGRNTVRFFDPEMETVVMERAALEKDLRKAVQERQFFLNYQAQIADGHLTGSEALVRWQHPQRGLISPAAFIPLAEETRLILPLGRWVLETACAQLAKWADRPKMSHLTVAVNVSAHQFRQADFVDQVVEVLHTTGANPQLLKLELTESLLLSNVEEIIEKMLVLKARGVGFSLDDFGTGYSSLSYLKRLPLDQLKIDQSFVRDVLVDPNDASIAKTVIALARSLGLGVTAVGVETEAQQDFLAGSGCHAYQGFFFSRPLSVESFEALAMRA